MTRECFVAHGLKPASLDQIAVANAIIKEYRADDLTLTLRQLYYQFVSRDLIPNTERSYKNLGSLISKGREAGLIPWTAIEDRGRVATRVQGEEDPRDVVAGLEWGICFDPWHDQFYYPEVWIEKDALIGTIERVCDDNRVTRLACKGYISASEAWRAGKRFERARYRGQDPIIIHLGDHDPSGIDMTRDNQDRASLFSGGPVEIKRIALTMDQIEQYDPPPNPAKLSDSRAENYVNDHGRSSWELDALEPRVIARLVQHALQDCITDQTAWDQVQDDEEHARKHLSEVHSRWDDITNFLDETRNA